MTTVTKIAATIALAGALITPALTSSSAEGRYYRSYNHPRAGAAAVGLGLGAAAATGAAIGAYRGYGPYAGYGYGSYPGYGYGAYAADPAYGAYGAAGSYDSGWLNEIQCSLSPSSINYVPCYNSP
jgi:hypothetical protein